MFSMNFLPSVTGANLRRITGIAKRTFEKVLFRALGTKSDSHVVSGDCLPSRLRSCSYAPAELQTLRSYKIAMLQRCIASFEASHQSTSHLSELAQPGFRELRCKSSQFCKRCCAAVRQQSAIDPAGPTVHQRIGRHPNEIITAATTPNAPDCESSFNHLVFASVATRSFVSANCVGLIAVATGNQRLPWLLRSDRRRSIYMRCVSLRL